MNIPNEKLINIVLLFLECKKVKENPWTELAFVFEFDEGHVSNSGYLYNGDAIRPATAKLKIHLFF